MNAVKPCFKNLESGQYQRGTDMSTVGATNSDPAFDGNDRINDDKSVAEAQDKFRAFNTDEESRSPESISPDNALLSQLVNSQR